jgi:hypothetical protein
MAKSLRIRRGFIAFAQIDRGPAQLKEGRRKENQASQRISSSESRSVYSADLESLRNEVFARFFDTLLVGVRSYLHVIGL